MQVNAFPIAEVVVDVVVAEKNSLDTTAGGKRFEARPVSLSKQTSSFSSSMNPHARMDVLKNCGRVLSQWMAL
jgi:hypothetical protein